MVVRLRFVMVRRGWTKVEVPDGWLQVIRGKRPSSTQWPRARSQQQVRQPGKPAPESKKPPTQPPSVSRRSVHPEHLRAAAVARIQRIQASLGALQPEDTEERQVLQSALEKAKRQAQVPPLEKQILATEEYIARAKKRLLQHDATTAAARQALEKAEHDKEVDVQGVADGEDLMQKLKTQVADPTMPTLLPADAVREVTRLQQMVVESQRQLQQHGVPVVPQGVSVVPSPISPFRIRKREDYVPATEHEVLEWMADRQEDMTAALIARNTTEAARISSLITDATRSLHPESVPPSMVTNMVRWTGSKEARTTSNYGLRGSRVSEASNPGPPQLRRLRRGTSSKVGPSPADDWFVPTWAGTCCPDSVKVLSQFCTQPASKIPTWVDATVDEDVAAALQFDLEGDAVASSSFALPVQNRFSALDSTRFCAHSGGRLRSGKCSPCQMTQPWRSLWSHQDIGRPGGWS